MITAVDTNILFDILIPGEPHLASSKVLLERHLTNGSLVLCETVFAELAARFTAEQVLEEFLAETGILFVPSSRKALHIAGTRWAEFSRKNRRDRFTCGACGNQFDVPCPRCGGGSWSSAISSSAHTPSSTRTACSREISVSTGNGSKTSSW